eukprot:169346-Chlamydomonas_euryale.AAC.9
MVAEVSSGSCIIPTGSGTVGLLGGRTDGRGPGDRRRGPRPPPRGHTCATDARRWMNVACESASAKCARNSRAQSDTRCAPAPKPCMHSRCPSRTRVARIACTQLGWIRAL